MSQEKLVLLTDPKFCIQTLTNLTRVEKIATRMCTRSAHCSTDIHLQIKGISETKAYVYKVLFFCCVPLQEVISKANKAMNVAQPWCICLFNRTGTFTRNLQVSTIARLIMSHSISC